MPDFEIFWGEWGHIELKHELDRSSGTFFLCGGSLRPVVSRLLHRIPISISYPLFIWLFSFFSFHNKIWNYLERIWTRVKLYFKTNQWPLVLRKQQKSWVIGILRMNQVLMGAVSWPQLEYCSHCGKISSVATFQIAFETIWWRVLVDHDVWPPIIEIISRHVLVDYVRRGDDYWNYFSGPSPLSQWRPQ